MYEHTWVYVLGIPILQFPSSTEKTKLSYYLITQTFVNECKRMRFNILIIEHSKISNFKTFTDVPSYVTFIDSIDIPILRILITPLFFEIFY